MYFGSLSQAYLKSFTIIAESVNVFYMCIIKTLETIGTLVVPCNLQVADAFSSLRAPMFVLGKLLVDQSHFFIPAELWTQAVLIRNGVFLDNFESDFEFVFIRRTFLFLSPFNFNVKELCTI